MCTKKAEWALMDRGTEEHTFSCTEHLEKVILDSTYIILRLEIIEAAEFHCDFRGE